MHVEEVKTNLSNRWRDLRLSVYEDRRIVAFLLELAQEEGKEDWKRCLYQATWSGNAFGKKFTVPQDWIDTGIPTAGFFSTSYRLPPTRVSNDEFRRKLAHKYLNWPRNADRARNRNHSRTNSHVVFLDLDA